MTRAGDDAERSDAQERRATTHAGDNAERSDAQKRRATTHAGDNAERREAVGARPHKWEVPPPACGGEWRS